MKQFSARANILKDNFGFASAFGLLFIALFSVFFLIAGFLRFTVDSRSDFRYFCFNDLHQVQKILLDHEERLLSLNPAAEALRLKLKYHYVQLATAIATENIPLATQAAIWIKETKQQQKILRFQQQALINFGQTYAQVQLLKSMTELNNKSRRRSNSWSEILHSNANLITNTLRPQMAVTADNDSDIAPVYKLNPDFENEQRITAFWTLWIFAKPSFQTLVKTNETWSLKCTTQPLNRNRLLPIVKADKL